MGGPRIKVNTNVSAPKGISSSGSNPLQMMIMKQMYDQQMKQTAPPELGENALATKSVGGSTTFIDPEAERVSTADAMNQLTRIKQLKGVTKNMEELAMNLPTDIGQAALGYGAAKLTGGRFGSEAVKTYSDAIPAASAGVYRAITGDNRLSDMDAAQRAKPLFWHPLEGSETREGKFAFLNYMMNEAEKNISPTAPKDDLESLARWQAFVKKAEQRFTQQKSSQTGATAQNQDKRTQYNQLRSQGVSAEEAKRRLGF